MNEYLETNRRRWDELVPIHLRSQHYDVDAFRSGKTSLCKVELEGTRSRGSGQVAAPPAMPLRARHAVLARMGAVVTGVDFSPKAVEAATALAAETRLNGRFLATDIYSLPEELEEQFDIVYTSYGALCWLPDVPRWAAVASHFLKPSGILYMVEFHPFPCIFDASQGLNGLSIRYPYFTPEEPIRTEEDGSYAEPEAPLRTGSPSAGPTGLARSSAPSSPLGSESSSCTNSRLRSSGSTNSSRRWRRASSGRKSTPGACPFCTRYGRGRTSVTPRIAQRSLKSTARAPALRISPSSSRQGPSPGRACPGPSRSPRSRSRGGSGR